VADDDDGGTSPIRTRKGVPKNGMEMPIAQNGVVGASV